MYPSEPRPNHFNIIGNKAYLNDKLHKLQVLRSKLSVNAREIISNNPNRNLL